MKKYVEDIRTKGFAIIPSVLDPEIVSRLHDELKGISSSKAVKQRGQSTFGIRNLLNVVPAIRELASLDCIRSLIDPILGKQAKVVRGIFFDKTSEANWKVTWHQDLTIAVCQRKDVTGFSSWSLKAGITHVQPPTSVLEEILALRLHLDDIDEFNGALKVIPGSHKYGRVSNEDIQRLKEEVPAATCLVSRGDVLAMRPLLLHSSSTSSNPLHRRVIHLEFSSTRLPEGLEWYGS